MAMTEQSISYPKEQHVLVAVEDDDDSSDTDLVIVNPSSSLSSDEDGDEIIVDLMPGPKRISASGPLSHIRELLRAGFCEPDKQQPEHDGTSAIEPSKEPQHNYSPSVSFVDTGGDVLGGDASFSSSSSSYEPIIINLKKALQQHGFCVPPDKEVNLERTPTRESDCVSSIKTRSTIDWEEDTKTTDTTTDPPTPRTSPDCVTTTSDNERDSINPQIENDMPEEVLDDEDEISYVVVTEPGCHRGLRIARALEIFVSTIFFLSLTFLTLQRLDIHVGMELRQKE